MRAALILLTTCLTAAVSACHTGNDTLFDRLSSGQTGITFSDDIERYEDNTLNPLDYDYLYNGGGVAVADFNNDGRTSQMLVDEYGITEFPAYCTSFSTSAWVRTAMGAM